MFKKKNNGEMLRYFQGHDKVDRTQDMWHTNYELNIYSRACNAGGYGI
jgi:hypothetical protein